MDSVLQNEWHSIFTLQWRHNEYDGILNHWHIDGFSGADQRKHQSSASLAFVRGFHWWPVNSLHKGPVTWKMFPWCHYEARWCTAPWMRSMGLEIRFDRHCAESKLYNYHPKYLRIWDICLKFVWFIYKMMKHMAVKNGQVQLFSSFFSVGFQNLL